VKRQRAHGAAVLDRLGQETVPPALRVPVKDFKDAQRDLERASAAADEARAVRDAALEAVAAADASLDASVGALADALVGAGLGTRQKPFGAFSRHSVSSIVTMAYAVEAKEVRALCIAVRRTKPSAQVAKAVARCEKDLAAVEHALAAVAKPQAAYAKALAKRDALFPTWTRAFSRLKRHAAVAWEDDPSTLQAVFAAPDAIVAPRVHRRKSKQAAANGAAAPSAPSA